MSGHPLERELWLIALSWRAGFRFHWSLFDPTITKLASGYPIRAKA